MEKKCPHCGAFLQEKASFCPYCAKSIRSREQTYPPRYISGRVVRSAVLILLTLTLVLSAALWLHTRPKVYDSGSAEAVYSDKSSGFYLCFSKEESPPAAVPENRYYSELDYPYRYPVRLYVTGIDGGSLMTDAFMERVATISAEISCSDPYVSVTCTEPQQHSEYYPNAAAVIFVDYSIVAPGEHDAELVCTLTMKNGDVIRLHQKQHYPSIATYQYTAQDAPMNTIQDLQALVDEISATVNEADQVYLYLPPIIYDGGLVIKDRCISLYGSVGTDGQRTTFTGPVQAAYQRGIYEFSHIDFTGSGQGAGIQALDAARVHLTDCRVSNWETGFLSVGRTWINANETSFEDNAVGMHFNSSQTAMVSDNFYTNNTFANNGTAVLLEHVGAECIMHFPGSRFTGNGTDIDNRCNQALELDGAAFE